MLRFLPVLLIILLASESFAQNRRLFRVRARCRQAVKDFGDKKNNRVDMEGYWKWKVERARKQRETVAWVHQMGGEVGYDYDCGQIDCSASPASSDGEIEECLDAISALGCESWHEPSACEHMYE